MNNKGAYRKWVNESIDAEGNGKGGGPRYIQQKRMNGIEGKRGARRGGGGGGGGGGGENK